MYQRRYWLGFLILIVLASAGCNNIGENPPTGTPDLQATIDAAVAATATAQVEAGVSDEYYEMTEEELATMIAAYAEESLTASEEASQAVDEAAQDGTITKEEQEHIEMVVSDAEQAVADTDEAIYAYYWLYGELADETLSLFEEIEDDIDELSALTLELVELLDEVDQALGNGLEVAQETIEQMQSTASQIQSNVGNWQGKGEAWVAALQAELEQRASLLSEIQPSEVAGNRREALLSAFGYVDAVREALADKKLTSPELSDITQLGVNAMASLDAFGGPQLQNLSGNIDAISTQLARGQISAAQSGLGALETALGSRPSR